MKSKKMISIAVISLFILSMFATVLIAFALSDPYITVSPSSVKPGQSVTVKGYGFTGGDIVGTYVDVVDNYHKLGNVTVNTAGRFTFKFVMQASYSGTHRIIAVNPSGMYSADFTLGYTNPLDQRLIDLIKGSLIDVGDIEAKLDTILGRLGTAPSGSTGNIWGDINRIYTYLTGTIYPAIDEVEGMLKDPTNGLSALNTDLDTILDRLGTDPYGSTGTIWGDINRIYTYLGMGLGGDSDSGTVTTDGTVQTMVWFAAPGHPIKCSVWLDTANMTEEDTIVVTVYLYFPQLPLPGSYISRLYSSVTYTGYQREDAKLIVDQLPVPYIIWVTILQTAGAPDTFTYHLICEEV